MVSSPVYKYKKIKNRTSDPLHTLVAKQDFLIISCVRTPSVMTDLSLSLSLSALTRAWPE